MGGLRPAGFGHFALYAGNRVGTPQAQAAQITCGRIAGRDRQLASPDFKSRPMGSNESPGTTPYRMGTAAANGCAAFDTEAARAKARFIFSEADCGGA